MIKFRTKKKDATFKEFFERLVSSQLSIDDLKKNAFEKHYSHSMLVEMIYRDYPQLFDGLVFTKKAMYAFMKQLGIQHDNSLYLRLPQEVKLQFKYPKDMSLESIRKLCLKQSAKGATTSQNIRKTWDAYNPKNRASYYEALGFSFSDAQEKASSYRKSKSPFSKTFLKYQNMHQNDIANYIGELSRNRGMRGLLSMRTGVSKLEVQVTDKLKNNNIICETQHVLGKYAYDIFIPSSNLIIEVNGTYWHADPRIYAADDVVHFPYGQIKAIEKWEKDEVKLSYAKSLNFNVIVLWEIDLQKEGYLDEFIKSKFAKPL